jgi:nitrite reductase/ring-hydroxylating ferredoxin subunit/membrane protease YdiL (CAAX protease family)
MQADLGPVTRDSVPTLAPVLVAGAWAASLVAVGWVARQWAAGRPVPAAGPAMRAPWGGLEVAAIVGLYLAASVAMLGLVPGGTELERQLAAGIATNMVATLGGLALLRGRGATWHDLGVGGAGRAVAPALVGLVVVLAPLLSLAAALDTLVPYRHPLVDFLATRRDAVAIGLAVAAAVVAAPIAEEFFFRRVLQGWLERRVAPGDAATAIVGSAAAFALAHTGQGLAWLPLFLFGIVLGWLAWRTGSILPCILLHAAFNAVSIAMLIESTQPGLEKPAVGGEVGRQRLQCQMASPEPSAAEPGPSARPPAAMTDWIPIAAAADCPPGASIERIVAGRVVAIANVAGRFHAVDGLCPHQGGPLGTGTLCGTTLTCPWHGWQFDVTTGRHMVSATVRQAVHEVREEAGRLFVRLADPPEPGCAEPA